MLEDSLFESRHRQKTRKPMTVVMSVTAHIVTVILLILIPLLQTQALTIPPVNVSLLLPRMAMPQAVTVFSGKQPGGKSTSQNLNVPVLTTPTFIPARIASVDEPAIVDAGPFLRNRVSGIGPLGPSLGIAAIEPVAPTITTPAPPPSPPPSFAVRRIRQSVGVQAAKLIHQVTPAYPPIAKQTRMQGVVVLEAIIGKDGSIDSLRVISGNAFLTQAALDAVKQWKYQPTLLNGEPVEVVTTVTVTFTLQ